MPRNASGTYSSPAGNPVVTGTSISSTVHNNTVADVAAELTDSLSRSGKGGMLAPLRFPDGTNAAPSVAFTSETGSGLYRAGANDVRVSLGGTAKSGWNSNGFRVIDSASGNGINLAAPGLAGSYTVTLPAAAPASTLPVSMSNAGVLSAGQITAAQIANNTITATQIANQTITATQIANNTVTASQIANSTITATQTDGTFAPKASPTFTGTVTVPTPSNGTDAATKAYADSLNGSYTAIGAGTANGATLLTVNYSQNNKFRFKIVLYLSAPNGAKISCAPSTTLNQYEIMYYGSGAGGTTTGPTLAAQSGGTTAIQTGTIGNNTNSGLLVVNGEVYVQTGATSGSFTCSCVATGGSIVAGSFSQVWMDN